MKEFDTFAELQASTQNRTGTRFVCRERANANYTLQTAGYVALAGDATFANGRVAALQFLVGSSSILIYPENFGAAGDGVTDDYAAIAAGLSRLDNKGGVLKLSSFYLHSQTIYINTDNTTVEGDGRGTGLTRSNGGFGDSLVFESPSPTTTTIFRAACSNFEINCSVEMNSGALLRVTEAAYCTFQNISLQNGFIGFRGQGLRASEIDVIHIRSGQLWSGVKVGSRFCLLEDSPRPTVGENVEFFISNFNFATNGVSAYVEYGLEVKEADGIWFDSGHIRGAKLANCFINGGASPQLLGLKFDNVWFDGLTDKCLLTAGTSTGYTGFIMLNDCNFTGGTVHAVHVTGGTAIDWIEFNNCNTWSIDAQITWNIGECDNVIINNATFKALNTSNAASASAILVGANVANFVCNGGSLFDSVNIDYGINLNALVEQATINGFSFRDLPDSSKTILIGNPAYTTFNTAGCTTSQTSGYVTGNAQHGEANSLATDTATSVNIGECDGVTMSVGLKLNTLSHGLIALETTDPSSITIIAGGANLAVTTGVLTGTTGAAGKLTVSITDAGVLYFENRTGVTRSVVWKILNRNY